MIEIIHDLTLEIVGLETEYTDNTIFIYGTFPDDLHEFTYLRLICVLRRNHIAEWNVINIILKSNDDHIMELQAKGMKPEYLCNWSTLEEVNTNKHTKKDWKPRDWGFPRRL
jgi:hypothetical protein